MLPALYDDDRLICGRLAIMLCCGALFIMPFASTHSSSASAETATSRHVASIPKLPKRLHEPAIVLARDPFVPDADVWVNSVADLRASGNYSPIDIGLPPNAGAGGASDSTNPSESVTPVVRAVVLGSAARALVETDGSVQVVAVGDVMGGSTVTSITANGIVLADGQQILLIRSHS